jgi:uncharacterized membrane protein YdjX (TVP38/TMEM64 family)
VGALVLILATTSIVAYRLGWFDYTHTLRHIERLRRSQNAAVFVAGFFAIYAAGTAIGLPGMPFNVAAGALLGTAVGGAIAWGSSVAGACIGYWVARTVGHNEVLRWIRRFKRSEAAIAQAHSFNGILRLRLIPVLPIGVVNFVGGLARAPFGAYVIATAIGVLPSVAIYSYFADSLVEGVGSGRKDAVTSLLAASALLILLSIVPRFVRARAAARGP